MSGRMDSACPSLMYAGPSDVTMFLNSLALATYSQVPCSRPLLNLGHSQENALCDVLA